MNRIVILGAGFGGLSCALELARKTKKSGGASITLVDRHAYHLFMPNLFEVAAADDEFTSVQQLKKSIAFPLAEIVRGTVG